MQDNPPLSGGGDVLPHNPDRLRTDVLDLLADIAAPPKAAPKALIAPHAGYIYSGRVAAAAFATLRDARRGG